MKYRVTLAKFLDIDIEADSPQEAEDIAAMMEDEEIYRESTNETSLEIWITRTMDDDMEES